MDYGHNHFKTLSELDENVLQPLKTSFVEVTIVRSCSYPKCNSACNVFQSLNFIVKYSLFFVKTWRCLGCLLTLVCLWLMGVVNPKLESQKERQQGFLGIKKNGHLGLRVRRESKWCPD